MKKNKENKRSLWKKYVRFLAALLLILACLHKPQETYGQTGDQKRQLETRLQQARNASSSLLDAPQSIRSIKSTHKKHLEKIEETLTSYNLLEKKKAQTEEALQRKTNI